MLVLTKLAQANFAVILQ